MICVDRLAASALCKAPCVVCVCVAAVSDAHLGSWLPASLEVLRVSGVQRCCADQQGLVQGALAGTRAAGGRPLGLVQLAATCALLWVLVAPSGTPPLFWPAGGCVQSLTQRVMFVHGEILGPQRQAALVEVCWSCCMPTLPAALFLDVVLCLMLSLGCRGPLQARAVRVRVLGQMSGWVSNLLPSYGKAAAHASCVSGLSLETAWG